MYPSVIMYYSINVSIYEQKMQRKKLENYRRVKTGFIGCVPLVFGFNVPDLGKPAHPDVAHLPPHTS
jgi:hypothetical protein